MMMLKIGSVALVAALAVSQADSGRSIGQLILELKDPDKRIGAVIALGALGPAATEAVPALESLATDADTATRTLAAQALFNIDADNPYGLSLLVRLVERGTATERGNAAQALGKIGPAAHLAVPALIVALAEKDPHARGMVVWALGQIGVAASAAAPHLAQMMKSDPSQWIRDDARWARYRVQHEDSIKELVKLLDGEGDNERQMAAQILGEKGPAAADAIPALVDALQRRSNRPSSGGISDGEGFARVRLTAAWALGEIASTETTAIEALTKVAANSGDVPAIRGEATKALNKIDSRQKSR